MNSTSPVFDPMHPLLVDRKRFDRILDVMYAKIQQTLFSEKLAQGRKSKTEQILRGTAVSAEDVLAEASEAILRYPVARLDGSWEALAVVISRNKAVSALRAAKAGLRGTEHREPLRLVSGDTYEEGAGRDSELAPFEVLPSDWGDPEEEYWETERALKLRNLARDVLDERSRYVFLAIYFEGRSRVEIGKELGVTGQRVGQVFREACEQLSTDPDNPFKADDLQQGGANDH